MLFVARLRVSMHPVDSIMSIDSGSHPLLLVPWTVAGPTKGFGNCQEILSRRKRCGLPGVGAIQDNSRTTLA